MMEQQTCFAGGNLETNLVLLDMKWENSCVCAEVSPNFAKKQTRGWLPNPVNRFIEPFSKGYYNFAW